MTAASKSRTSDTGPPRRSDVRAKVASAPFLAPRPTCAAPVDPGVTVPCGVDRTHPKGRLVHAGS